MALEQSALQGQQHEISEEARKALGRARKILDMASRPPDENDSPAVAAAKAAERAAAVEKYQQVLLDYNLSQAMVDQTGAEAEGRREEAKLKAGVYNWQRELWEAVAELNFCLYYCNDVWREQRYKPRWSDSHRTRYIRGKEHEVIGRVVNTRATINLCTYIEAAIEKATREAVAEVVGSSDKADINPMLFSRFACDFRVGAADDVVRRINAQRKEQLRQEAKLAREAAERAAETASSSVSDGTSLVIASYVKTERDLNRDHARGVEPGTTARERAEAAMRAVQREREHAEWAAANPEEARKQAEEQRKANERYWARRSGNYRGGPAPKERDHRAYRMGSSAGAKIGLDIQTGGAKSSGALS
jgi:hypothetical protein